MAGNPGSISYAEEIRTWLDPRAVAAIREELPALADEIVSAIEREVPEYSDSLRGAYAANIRLGTEQALLRFIGEGDAQGPAVYRGLGYGEHQAGRSLDALQAAYRIGARLAWRGMSRAAARAGASAEMQLDLAEAMFAYIDQLAAESVDGFAAAQLARAGDVERRRSVLLETLLGARPAEQRELADASAEAKWPLPRTLACLSLDGDPGPLARRLSGDVLYGSIEQRGCLIAPNPAGLAREAQLACVRLGVRAGLGPTVALDSARTSLHRARLASELPLEPGVVIAEQHLVDVALQAAPEIVASLRERALAPLSGERAASRTRLEETLRAWLQHAGSQRAAAAALSVHPQTVRYRVSRLRELFGAALDDPEQRLELEIALRAPMAAAR